MYNLSADGDGWMSALLYLVANFLNVSPMLHKFLIILCYGYWYSFCLRLNSKLLLLISGFQQQIKPDIASPATLSFIGAWQQRGKNLMNVKDLLNTIVLSAPVTGWVYWALCCNLLSCNLQFFECCWLQYMILWMLSIAIYDSLNVC